jgi:hypothetical protein
MRPVLSDCEDGGVDYEPWLCAEAGIELLKLASNDLLQ